MKKKNKKAQLKRKKEFRFRRIQAVRKNGKKLSVMHPAYVFLEEGNIYVYVSLTHSSHIEDVLLIKLRRNPNPIDSRDAYIVAEVKRDTKDRFGKNKEGWIMDPADDLMIRQLFKKK